MILLLLSPLAQAATLVVGVDHPTIQEAVDAASDGDLIIVETGHWMEEVFIDRDLTVVALDREGTRLVGPNDEAALTVQGAEVVWVGIDIQGLYRGVEVRDASLRMVDMEIFGARLAEGGGGLYGRDSSIELSQVDFSDNDVGEGVGGHVFCSGCQLHADHSSLVDASAHRGGAMLLSDSQTTLVSSGVAGTATALEDEEARGGAIRVEGGSLVLYSSGVSGTVLGGSGGGISALETAVELHDSSVQDSLADGGYGGAITLYDSSLLLDGGSLADNTARDEDGDDGFGGGLVSMGDSPGGVVLRDTRLLRNQAERGGAIRMITGSLQAERSLFQENSATRGGAIYSSSVDDHDLSATVFEGNSADYGGAISYRPGEEEGRLTLDGVQLRGNTAIHYGGGLYANGAGEVRVVRSAVEDNAAATGGAMLLWSVSQSEVRASCLRGNAASATEDAHGGAAMVYQSGATAWSANLLSDNSADGRGGALRLSEVGEVDLSNLHLLGNRSDEPGAALSLREVDSTLIRNDLVAWSEGAVALAVSGEGSVEGGYNALLDNDGGDGSAGDVLSDALTDDPLVGWLPHVACYDDEPWLGAASPLVDAGDPELLDPDASRSDIGAYGGPYAELEAFTDADGDGWTAPYDCDDDDSEVHPLQINFMTDGADTDCDGSLELDTDGDGHDYPDDCNILEALVYPGAPDVPYDGIDADCAGDSDYDADGDEHDHALLGGDDCDDSDPEVHPGAFETVGDGIDQDCDGADLELSEDEPEGCGCATSTGAPWWALALLPLLGWRRRP